MRGGGGGGCGDGGGGGEGEHARWQVQVWSRRPSDSCQKNCLVEGQSNNVIRINNRVEDGKEVTSSTTSPSTAWASCCTVSKLCRLSFSLVCNSWVSFCRKATSCCSAALLAAATFLICVPQCTVRQFAAANLCCVLRAKFERLTTDEVTSRGHTK